MTEIRVRKSFDNGAGQKIEEFIVQDEPGVVSKSAEERRRAEKEITRAMRDAVERATQEAHQNDGATESAVRERSGQQQSAARSSAPDAQESQASKRRTMRKKGASAAVSAANGNKAKTFKQKALDKTPEKLKNPSEMQVRIRTGAIYITLTVFCVLASNISTALYLSALSAICAGEFYFILRSDAKLPNELLGIIAAACLPLAMWLFGIDGVAVVMVVFVLVLLVWYVFWMPARIVDVAVSLFGAAYIGLSGAAAMMLRMSLPDFWGGVFLLGLFMSIWANDVFAYLVGSAIGKHKLAPSVSPKKSWEGFIAGLLFSMGFWCLLTLIPPLNVTIPQALVFGLIAGLAGVLGDLVESRIKRNSGVKDSGTIMPGHGGLFDRCDSQFPVTIVSVLLLVLFNCVTVVG